MWSSHARTRDSRLFSATYLIACAGPRASRPPARLGRSRTDGLLLARCTEDAETAALLATPARGRPTAAAARERRLSERTAEQETRMLQWRA